MTVRLHFCGVIQDGLFTCWKVGFVFDPQLYELQLPVLSFSTFHSGSLWRANTTIFAKLNKPPSLIRSPVSIKPPSKAFEINMPPGELVEDLR